jgi:hypothetical protein
MKKALDKLEALKSEVEQMQVEIEARQQYIQRALGAINVLEQLIAESSNENVDSNSGGQESEQSEDSQGN